MNTTFPRLLQQHASQRPVDAALREKEYGIWQSLNWADLYTMVGQIAHVLARDGLQRGDHVVIVGANRPRLSAAMLAVQSPQFVEQQIQAGQPDDVAAMFFTSGTTGNAKGVVHTHRSLLDRAKAGADFDKLTSREEVLAYLPPAWIGQNIFSYAQWLCCGYVVNCPESTDTVTIDLKEIGPTYYFAPPRVFEGLLTQVMIRMEDASAPKRGTFKYFMDLAREVGPRRMDG